MRVNLLDPQTIRIGQYELLPATLRKGLLWSLPAILVSLGIVLGSALQLYSANEARDRAVFQETLLARQVNLHNRDSLKTLATRLQALRDTFSDYRVGYVTRLADVIAIGNALPSKIRLRKATAQPTSIALSGETDRPANLADAQTMLDHDSFLSHGRLDMTISKQEFEATTGLTIFDGAVNVK